MSTQLGLITAKQARACGLSLRQIQVRISSGRWKTVHPGVYRLLGSEGSWRQSVLAACFSAGDTAAASHVTAGLLLGLIERRKVPPIEVTLPIRFHPQSLGFVVHRTRLPFEVVRVGPIPVTAPARTVIDLAAVITEPELDDALDIAIRRHGVVAAELVRALETTKSRRGIALLRRLVAIRVGRAGDDHGVFATRFARLLRDADLPTPELEYEIRRGGVLVAKVDLCYPRERVAIELDDWDTHGSPRALTRDNVRQNAIEDAGYAVRRFTWNHLDRPNYAVGVVRRALFERGHPDVVSI
jgi:hypothetical protein